LKEEKKDLENQVEELTKELDEFKEVNDGG